jgi:hypothetical protein
MLTGSAVATFSDGDPPQVLKHSQDGNWSGTWQPRTATTSKVTIQVSAQIPEQKLKGSVQISGGLRTNLSVPIITPGAVLSSASLVAQSPIAPGSLISILGSILADSLAGTSVLIAGRPAPIVSVSGARIDAIVPYDIPPNTQHQVIVQKGSVVTVPETVTVAPAQPAVFTQNKSGTGQASVFAAGRRIASTRGLRQSGCGWGHDRDPVRRIARSHSAGGGWHGHSGFASISDGKCGNGDYRRGARGGNAVGTRARIDGRVPGAGQGSKRGERGKRRTHSRQRGRAA